MLAKITKYMKAAIYDPVTGYLATIGSKGEISTAITDPTSGDQTSVGTVGELKSTLYDADSLKSAEIETMTDITHNIDEKDALITASAMYGRESATFVTPIAAKTFIDETDNIGGENALITASVIFGMDESQDAKPILATTLTNSSDDIDGINALTTASAIFGRVDDNTVAPIVATADKYLAISDQSSPLAIASGAVTGHTVVNKFGKNASCGATPEEIWDGDRVYIWPTTASITHLRTSTDTPAMDGLVVEVQGLADDYSLSIQDVIIDASTSTATEVILSPALRRVFRMKVKGSVVTTDPIWVGPTGMTAATASGIIQVGNNQTLMSLYTVPLAKTAYMTSYYATANPNNAAGTLFTTALWARDNANGYAPQLKHTLGLDKDGTSGFQHTFNPYYKFTEKTDIYITGSAGTNTVSISAGFDLISVDN